jgi:hypothetical protein
LQESLVCASVFLGFGLNEAAGAAVKGRYFSRPTDRLGLEDVHAFQVHLVATGISWPALNQIVCALRFFYGVTLGQPPPRRREAR